ncbi:MAG TPA: redoxin domain-containing protein [Thermomicrobiaceae bacterium]|nr:redoxin domain-containing protein [Thermomicrobiaceae bacterium]
MSELQDNLDEFRRAGAQVFGLSADAYHSQHAFAVQRELEFPMLSDFNKEAMTALGIKMEDSGGYHGVSRRSIFILAQDGTVAYADVPTERGVRPDVPAALAKVQQLASK